jgi:hypothetical protein
VVGGPGDHAVYAHQGCCRKNEESLLWSGLLYLLTRQQQLHLPCRPATELRRTQRGESHVRLYRNSQEVRSVPTEIPVHDRTVPVSCHPHERNSSATCARSPDDTGVRTCPTTAEEGRGAVRGTQESHRSSSPALAQVEVRPRAVLPGGHRPEHQTSGTVPQPDNNTTGTCHCLGRGTENTPAPHARISPRTPEKTQTFSTPTPVITS